ncbi:MAG TPA: DUF5714 domain-containing protein [Anaerolineaceae bacterium]|nr:DUF5714 domain-containing protein [Anaerolineaceae bacterium]
MTQRIAGWGQSDQQDIANERIQVYSQRTTAVKMHGHEHHFLVPAVLLTASYNYGFFAETITL